MDIWQEILKIIESKSNRQTFNTWFKPTRLKRREGNKLYIVVPNETIANWLNNHYSDLISEATRTIGEPKLEVFYEFEDNSSAAKKDAEGAKAPYQATLNFDSVEYLLNPKYTFHRFVVASCNQFAHAAALAVSENPTRIYNPLFIYGGVGLGKTHLMQAVGHKIKSIDQRLRLSYVSSEKFTNEVVNAIRYDKTLALREKYRNVDVLLVDDIQFISGKQATQEEFFHTFNTLYDGQKQIVLSSDSLPKEIPDIQERLQSRFEWGLIADIQPPDLETKVAILKKKAEFENFDLPDNVAFFIASKIKSNVRELEGSLVRLIAFSSLRGEAVSLSMAQEVLKHILKSQEKHVTIENIQKTVADRFSLKVHELTSKNNSKQIAQPRQIAMYLCRRLTSASLPEIGREFGGKHHTTVLHSIKKVEEQLATSKDFNSLVNRLIDSLQ